MSQFFYLGPGLYFVIKNGELVIIFLTVFFPRFHKIKTKT